MTLQCIRNVVQHRLHVVVLQMTQLVGNDIAVYTQCGAAPSACCGPADAAPHSMRLLMVYMWCSTFCMLWSCKQHSTACGYVMVCMWCSTVSMLWSCKSSAAQWSTGSRGRRVVCVHVTCGAQTRQWHVASCEYKWCMPQVQAWACTCGQAEVC